MYDLLMEILAMLVAIFAIMFMVGIIALMGGFLYQATIITFFSQHIC